MNSEHGRPRLEYGNEPLLTDAQLKQVKLENMEKQAIRTICREFDIPIRDVYEASFSLTGKDGVLNWKGMEIATGTPFPTSAFLLSPKKGGKGKPFTFNRLLANPMQYYLFADFCDLVKDTRNPVLHLCVHPRVKSFIAMTNLPMSPDYLCYQTTFDPIAELRRLQRNKRSDQEPNHHEQQKQAKSGMQVVTFGEFERILQAMRRQELWVPW
jgi:hypothetical protein